MSSLKIYILLAWSKNAKLKLTYTYIIIIKIYLLSFNQLQINNLNNNFTSTQGLIQDFIKYAHIQYFPSIITIEIKFRYQEDFWSYQGIEHRTANVIKSSQYRCIRERNVRFFFFFFFICSLISIRVSG